MNRTSEDSANPIMPGPVPEPATQSPTVDPLSPFTPMSQPQGSPGTVPGDPGLTPPGVPVSTGPPYGPKPDQVHFDPEAESPSSDPIPENAGFDDPRRFPGFQDRYHLNPFDPQDTMGVMPNSAINDPSKETPGEFGYHARVLVPAEVGH